MSRYRASAGITENWEHFDFSVDDGVATVTLNRPEKMNPLTFESYADLRDLLTELPHRGDTKVLVIRGQGKGFCGGGDVNEIIGELIKMDAHDLMGFTKMTGEAIRAMRECPVPIIAGIQGIAAGIGFLGAGTILKKESEEQIQGLTTAATIFLTAAVGAASVHAALADSNDATYAETGDNPAGSTFTVALPALDAGDITVRTRNSATAASPAITRTIALLQGSTVAASRTVTLSTTVTEHSFTLTTEELALVTDFMNRSREAAARQLADLQSRARPGTRRGKRSR